LSNPETHDRVLHTTNHYRNEGIMNLSDSTISNVLAYLWDSEGCDYADEYGEPGYGRHDLRGVVVGNFDPFMKRYPRIMEALEASGVEFEYYDEWAVVDGKAYRTAPDSYGWLPSILLGNGEFLTAEDGIEAWIEEVVNTPTRALYGNVWSEDDMIAAGFVRFGGEFATGWHAGQDDDPTEVLAQASETYNEVVLRIDYSGQWDTHWQAWVR